MGRDLVQRYLEGRSVDRPPVVLHLGAYAARLQQLGYRQMCADPTLLANSLQSAVRLFDCDGLIVLADPTIEAEACGCDIAWQDDQPVVATHPLCSPTSVAAHGCSGATDGAFLALDLRGVEGRAMDGRGRLATVLEATGRLGAVIGKDLALIPAVTGPVTLAAHLRGTAFWTDLEKAPEQAYRVLEAGAQVVLLLSRHYLDMGFDKLALYDPEFERIDPVHLTAVTAVLGPFWNVIRFYDAHVLLQTDMAGGERLERAAVASGASDYATGIAIPAPFLEQTWTDLEASFPAWRAQACSAGSLAVCFTIPRATPPENVHAVVRLLRR